MSQFVLPTEPLVRAVRHVVAIQGEETKNGSPFGTRAIFGPSFERAYQRLKARTHVSWDTADRWSVRLGYHPSDIYGSAWWNLLKEMDEAS